MKKIILAYFILVSQMAMSRATDDIYHYQSSFGTGIQDDGQSDGLIFHELLTTVKTSLAIMRSMPLGDVRLPVYSGNVLDQCLKLRAIYSQRRSKIDLTEAEKRELGLIENMLRYLNLSYRKNEADKLILLCQSQPEIITKLMAVQL